MYILLIAATGIEIQPAADYFKKNGDAARNREIETLLTGIGSVSTTYFLTRKIQARRPDLIIQAGIAGCFGEKKLAELVTVKEDSFADMGAVEDGQFKNIFDLRLADKDSPPFRNGVLINPHENLLSLPLLDQVKGISVNEITTDKTRLDWHKQKYSPVVESMEGAAFHYVCLTEMIPFLQIRGISNYIGERDKTKWKIREAIQALNEKLIGLINSL
jgi:futalosine hydrolase